MEPNEYVNVLKNKAYDEVRELAYKQIKWQENMVLVRKQSSTMTLWVAKSIAYNESNGYEVVDV
jgi:hypothetical protein